MFMYGLLYISNKLYEVNNMAQYKVLAAKEIFYSMIIEADSPEEAVNISKKYKNKPRSWTKDGENYIEHHGDDPLTLEESMRPIDNTWKIMTYQEVLDSNKL